MTVTLADLSFSLFTFQSEPLAPPRIVTEPVTSSEEPADPEVVQDEVVQEVVQDEAPSLEDSIALAGFRSPSTINMLQRLHQRLVDGLEGESRAEVEAALVEMVDLSGELSRADHRPFGRSIEHKLMLLFNGASRHHPVLPAIEEAIEPAESSLPETEPVAVDSTVSDVVGSELALDVSV